jgi:hypothetical protein
MKSERRHELQHNELAEWLAKAIEAIKPYQNLILAGVALVLVAMVGYTLYNRAVTAQSAQAWNDINTALETGDLASLSKVSEDYPNTTAAYMASIVQGDNYLAAGCTQLFKNKPLAEENLSKAINHYEAIRLSCRTPSIRERAVFGLARAREAKGELEEAKPLYEEVAKDVNGTYAKAASERLADLARPATRAFYDDFAHFDPKPEFSEAGKKPDFDKGSLPAEGSVAMPPAQGGGKAKEPAKSSAKDAPKQPAKADKTAPGKSPAK